MLIKAIFFKPKFVHYGCNELCKTGPRGRAASGLQLSVDVSIDRRGSNFGQKAAALSNPADKNNPKLMKMTLAFFANEEIAKYSSHY